MIRLSSLSSTRRTVLCGQLTAIAPYDRRRRATMPIPWRLMFFDTPVAAPVDGPVQSPHNADRSAHDGTGLDCSRRAAIVFAASVLLAVTVRAQVGDSAEGSRRLKLLPV